MKQEFTAQEAKEYIALFSKHIMPGCTHLTFADNDVIYFSTMTDEQAIRAANGLVLIEAEAAKGAVKQ